MKLKLLSPLIAQGFRRFDTAPPLHLHTTHSGGQTSLLPCTQLHHTGHTAPDIHSFNLFLRRRDQCVVNNVPIHFPPQNGLGNPLLRPPLDTMAESKAESTAAGSNIAVMASTESLREEPRIATSFDEKSNPSITPDSPRPVSSKVSRESVRTPTKGKSSSEAAFRPSRRFPTTPSTHASADDRRRGSVGDEIRPISPVSLSSLSDFNGSEDSHTERRFLRHYEELESHCTGNRLS